MSDGAFTAQSVEETFGFKSRFVSTREGERMHYIDEGNPTGIPVVFVHGSAAGITAAANFYLNIPALTSRGYRALAPDLYGFGWTEPAPGTEPGVQPWTDQIVAFMDALGIDQAYLVGNSLGGRISTRVTVQHPGRVLGNIVIGNGGAFWPEPRPKGPRASREEVTVHSEESVRAALTQLVNNPAMVSEDLVKYRTKLANKFGAPERFAETARFQSASVKVTRLDVALAKTIQVPLLVIYGREDHVGPPENALALAEAFPNADLVVFGHSGHWTMVERADDFNMLMLRFVEGTYARRIVSPPVRSHDLKAAALREEYEKA